MFFVIPFRAKNPPERFPYVTIALIAINILVYACTTQDFLQVRESYVRDDYATSLALSYDNMNAWRFLTSMFLHGNLLHLGGNMLFLWVFGSAVEGRLGHLTYFAVYMLAGLFGGLAQTLIFGHAYPHVPSLGASGAIMGVVACYAWMFTFSTVRVFYFYWIPLIPLIAFLIPRLGVADWEAWWVVAFFFLYDLVTALLTAGGDGVAHFAHYGGILLGLAAMLLLRPKRDTEHFSNMQAIRSDIKDYDLMAFNELEILMERPNNDALLIFTYCEKAIMETSQRGEEKCQTALATYWRLLLDQADPIRLANLVLKLRLNPAGLPTVLYLGMATRMEQMGKNDVALHLYNRVYEINPTGLDSERALYRFGYLMERAYFDVDQARAAYTELLRLFPNGYMAYETRQALARLGSQVSAPAQRIPQVRQNAAPSQAANAELPPAKNEIGSRMDFLETGD
jgi:membrane associated rhomboid family serine protease